MPRAPRKKPAAIGTKAPPFHRTRARQLDREDPEGFALDIAKAHQCTVAAIENQINIIRSRKEPLACLRAKS